jgi:hypothetical protein
MAQRKDKRRRTSRTVISESDPKKLLEILLALDRHVIELSMRLYNVPRGERFTMRAECRRVHDALRELADAKGLAVASVWPVIPRIF